MNALTLQSNMISMDVEPTMDGDEIDFVKTIKAAIKEQYGRIKDWTIAEDGKSATSNIDSSVLVLGGEKVQSSMARTLAEHAKNYTDSVSYKGTKSKICGDTISVELQGLDPDQVIDVAERVLAMDPGTLAMKYAHLNNGQRRMNAGNRIRGAVKKEVTTNESVLGTIKQIVEETTLASDAVIEAEGGAE